MIFLASLSSGEVWHTTKPTQARDASDTQTWCATIRSEFARGDFRPNPRPFRSEPEVPHIKMPKLRIAGSVERASLDENHESRCRLALLCADVAVYVAGRARRERASNRIQPRRAPDHFGELLSLPRCRL